MTLFLVFEIEYVVEVVPLTQVLPEIVPGVEVLWLLVVV